MLSLLGLLAALRQGDALSLSMDQAAGKRDLAAIRAAYGPEVLTLKRDPMAVLKTNGAYEVGSKGWHAYPLSLDDGKDYIVFSTPLTSEDIGERLFEIEGKRLKRYLAEKDDSDWKILRHDLSVRFELPTKRAILADDLSLSAAPNPGPLFLRYSPCYRIRSISYESGKPLRFAQAGGIVAVRVPIAGSVKLHIEYDGVVDLPNYAGSITDRYATLTNDYWYAMIGRRPAPYRLRVAVPNGWVVAAQGEIEPDEKSQGFTWKRFRMDLPVIYYSISAGAFRYYEEAVGSHNYRLWSFRMSPQQMSMQAKLYAPIIDFYSRNFAPYPFTSWGAVDQPNYGGGMLEAYSYNTTQEGILPDEEPHEPSHTWWGGLIENRYLVSFWNESFASYCEGLYSREAPIGNHEERRLAFVATPLANPAYDTAPLDDAPADIGGVAGELGYGKGAYVLQMLEQTIGTEAMLKSMRSWLAATPPGSIGEWADFERHVAPAQPQFFKDWVKRPGFAKFTVEDVAWAAGSLTWKVKFDGPTYVLPLEVMTQDAKGTRQFFQVAVDSSHLSFKVACPQKPVLASFDPWRRLVRPVGRDEAPIDLSSMRGKVYRDPAQPQFAPERSGAPASDLGSDLDGTCLVGSPETWPLMRPLCEKVGFSVSAGKLTYKGTTVDLSNGGAAALVDLGSGGRCKIVLGRSALAPRTGRARLCVYDGFGRFLRGITEPKTRGPLTFRL